MPAAGWAPHVVAGGDFAVGVDQRALENQGLLDTDVLVVGQTAPGAIRIKAVSRPVASSTSKVLASTPGNSVGSQGSASTSTSTATAWLPTLSAKTSSSRFTSAYATKRRRSAPQTSSILRLYVTCCG